MSPLPENGEASSSKDLQQAAGGCAASDAADDPIAHAHDPGLQAVVEAWPALPSAVRAGVLAMVRAAVGAGGQKP